MRVTARKEDIDAMMRRSSVKSYLRVCRHRGVNHRIAPNGKCPCGSTKKFKKCCGRRVYAH